MSKPLAMRPMFHCSLATCQHLALCSVLMKRHVRSDELLLSMHLGQHTLVAQKRDVQITKKRQIVNDFMRGRVIADVDDKKLSRCLARLSKRDRLALSCKWWCLTIWLPVSSAVSLVSNSTHLVLSMLVRCSVRFSKCLRMWMCLMTGLRNMFAFGLSFNSLCHTPEKYKIVVAFY